MAEKSTPTPSPGKRVLTIDGGSPVAQMTMEYGEQMLPSDLVDVLTWVVRQLDRVTGESSFSVMGEDNVIELRFLQGHAEIADSTVRDVVRRSMDEILKAAKRERQNKETAERREREG